MPNYEIVPRIGAFEISINGVVSKFTNIKLQKYFILIDFEKIITDFL